MDIGGKLLFAASVHQLANRPLILRKSLKGHLVDGTAGHLDHHTHGLVFRQCQRVRGRLEHLDANPRNPRDVGSRKNGSRGQLSET